MMPTVRELFALVASADLVITPDTAVSHIAAAFGRPTLTLLRRRAEYHIWIPYRTPGRNVFGDAEETIDALPAERAIAALDDLLEEWLPAHGVVGQVARHRRPITQALLARR
jgi:ADP-heptose:LPS heptosyltransferase